MQSALMVLWNIPFPSRNKARVISYYESYIRVCPLYDCLVVRILYCVIYASDVCAVDGVV
jgi:hypothetical protein